MGITVIFSFLDRASMRYPRSCRAAASLSHVFLTRSRRQAMATTAPLLSPQHARPAHLPRRLPPPLHLASHLDVPAKRMRLRRAPPPCTAKFGKFDASDAPARGGRVGGSCSGRWGGAARGGGRQVRLTAPSTRACVIENTKDAVCVVQLLAIGFGGRDSAVGEGER